MLRDAYSKMTPPFTLDDAENLMNVVHCSFVDGTKAESQQDERTLANIKADLSKPEIHISWFLRDVGPIAGTNHMEDKMSDFYTFGFSSLVMTAGDRSSGLEPLLQPTIRRRETRIDIE